MNLSELAIGIGSALTLIVVNLLLLLLGNWVKTKAGTEKLNLVTGFALQAVMQVEQLWRSGQLKEDSRYAAACDYLLSKFPGLTEAELEAYIESAVAEVKVQLGEWSKPQDVSVTPQSRNY